MDQPSFLDWLNCEEPRSGERYRFTVPSVPVPQPRQRHSIYRDSRGQLRQKNYTPVTHPVNAFKAMVQIAAAEAGIGSPIDGPVGLSVLFVLPRPQSLKQGPRVRHDKRPDMDNLLKSLLDALNHVAWRDDSRISLLSGGKCYASSTEQPHVEVEIEEL